jgi:hypothetical protein
MNDEEQEYLNAQEDQKMRATAQRVAMQTAADQKERTIHNENFLNELRKADIDTGGSSPSIEDEFSDWFSGARAVTNRGDDWELEADLRMMNKREQAVTERRPGRLLRDRPFLLASMRGDDSPQLDAYKQEDIPGDEGYWREKIKNKDRTNKPMSSKMMSRVYGSAEVAADLMILSRNAAGLDSVSTVKTETTTRRQEEEDSTASRLGRVLE